MPRIVFVNENQAVEVPAGTSVRQAALSVGIEPNRDFANGVHCPDMGLCGQCLVFVKQEDASCTSRRNLREWLFGARKGWQRLACQVRVTKDVQVWTQRGGDERVGLARELVPQQVSPVAPPAGAAGAAGDAEGEASDA